MPFGQTSFSIANLVPGAGAGLPSLPGAGGGGGSFASDLLGIAGGIFQAREARKLLGAQEDLIRAQQGAAMGFGSMLPTIARGAGAVVRSPGAQGVIGGLAGSMLPDFLGGGGGGRGGPMPGVRLSKTTPRGNPTNAIWLDRDFDDRLVFWKRVVPKGWKVSGSTRVTGSTGRRTCRPR